VLPLSAILWRGTTLNAKLITFFVLILATSAATATADVAPNQTVHLTNGATAVSYDHCGDNDLCGRISYQDGSTLSVYSEGAALCQPYYLHFVESDTGGRTVYEFSRQINHTTPKGFSCGTQSRRKWCSIGATCTCSLTRIPMVP
jgi:hypothetical protein